MSKNPSPVPPSFNGDTCPVCRRANTACICTSHHSVKQMYESGEQLPTERERPARPYSDHYLGVLTNEAMVFYYNRDAEGLAKWLRNALR